MNSPNDEVWDVLIAYEAETFNARAANLTHIAHYTNFAGLTGILETEELWFSSASATNDYREISHGKQMLQQMSSQGQPLFAPFEAIRKFDPSLWQTIATNFQNRLFGDQFHTYISCWSECDPTRRSHDDLTMWRGYAADGNGVAIVVEVSKLGWTDPFMSEIVACPVFYETEAEFAVRASRAFSLYLAGLNFLGTRVQSHLATAAEAFVELCFYLAVTHKHPGFQAESEWRFAWSRLRDPSSTGLARHLRAVLSEGNLSERFCFPIKSDPAVSHLPIELRELVTSIMIGPCSNGVLKRDGVLRLMEAKGFQHAAQKIEFSAIPYRTVK